MQSVTVLVYILIVIAFDHVNGQEVETDKGRVRGNRINILGKSLDVFHGIPFAKPPVGDLRFKHPQPVESWPEVKDATMEKPSCMQSLKSFESVPFVSEFQAPDDFSEDCLYLSIWKPSTATAGSNLAVMVWIYGGGFSIGSTRALVHNGQYLASENNVIVVSVNYRVGPLGFSYLGPDTIPGNMGLMDQLQGIKWTRNNIENFGGDSNKITLFGESAGSISVGYHLLSPLSQNFFNNGILESGSPIYMISSVLDATTSQARTSVQKLSEAFNCSRSSDADVYECLKKVDPQDITTTYDQLQLTGVLFVPVLDGYFLPSDLMDWVKKGKHKKANILTGVNKDEITLFYYPFLNVNGKTYKFTGETFGPQHLPSSISMTTQVTDPRLISALSSFYVSEQNPPLDYLQILNYLGSDMFVKCPTVAMSSVYSETNDVYLYSLNHRISTIKHPDWMGVLHGYELHLVFGLPLNDTLGFTLEEKELSRRIMTYWSNFAKTGNPNSPVPVSTTWLTYDKDNQTYMALDVGSNLATRDGFRRHQCAFVNGILPMISTGEEIKQPSTKPPVIVYASGSGTYSASFHVIISLLTLTTWMLLC